MPKAAQDMAVFPRNPSDFVALGSNFRTDDVREIWNLRTSQKVGTIQTDIGADHGALSPDGQYFTGMAKSKDKLLLFDTSQGRQVGEIPIGPGTISPETRFAGPNRAVTLRRKQPLKVWELPACKLIHEIELPRFLELYSLAVSPGGKYAGLVVKDDASRKQVLRIYDLVAGRLAESLAIDAFQEGSTTSCECLSFSPDGSELAGVFKHVGTDSRSWLVSWNLQTGNVAFQHTFPSSIELQAHSGTNESRDVTWFPDQKWLLLFGRYLFDRETGGPIWSVPEDLKLAGRETNVLSNNQILAVTGPYSQTQLTSIPLDRDKIAQSAAAVNAGGLPEDAGLPPLTVIAPGAPKVIALADDAPAWNVTPDELGEAAEPILTAPLPLDGDASTIHSVLFAGGTAPRAFVARESAAGNPGVEVWDLAAGSKLAPIELPFPSQVVAAAPDGSTILTRIAGSEGRLDLWHTPDGSHVAGWRPYLGDGDGKEQVQAAGFAGNQRLLTLSSGRKLVMWQLPELERIFVVENFDPSRQPGPTAAFDLRLQTTPLDEAAPPAQSLVNPQLPAISPTGTTLAIADSGRLQFLDAATGQPKGTVPIDGPLAASTFSPSGDQFAVLLSKPAGGALLTVNLTDGTVSHNVPLPVSGTWLQWCDEHRLLIDHRHLVDLQRRQIVWTYAPGESRFAEQQLDHRVWGILPHRSAASKFALAAVALPGKNEADKISGDNRSPNYLLAPGEAVSLQFDLRAKPPGDAAFDARVQAALAAQLASAGLNVRTGAPITLKISTETATTSRQMSFSPLGQISSPKTIVSEIQVVCRFAFLSRGQELWQHEARVSNLKFGLTRLQPGESIEEHLKQQQWKSVEELFSRVDLPQYLFPASARQGAGHSPLIAVP